MIHGPKEGGSYAERAQLRWAGECPSWVMALAAAADQAPSQGELAKKIGCSATAISAVIGNTYVGNLAEMEGKVMGALFSATVACPVFFDIARDRCITLQQMPFTGASPGHAQVWRACRNGCRHAIPALVKRGDRGGRGISPREPHKEKPATKGVQR